MKNKKSLRTKMVKMVVKEFMLNNLFNQSNGGWESELQTILKNTFFFKCELHEPVIKDSVVAGKIIFEKEDGENSVIDFEVLPTGELDK